jgi:two-component system sensor histidine kinase RegB
MTIARLGYCAVAGQALLALLLCFGGRLTVSRWEAGGVMGAELALVAVSALFLRALGAAEERVKRAEARERRRDRLVSIAALAGGAAHELSTPLSTIAVVARELERQGNASTAEDARLVLAEVERCRGLLREMANEGGREFEDTPHYLPLGSVIRSAIDELPDPEAVRVELTAGVDFQATIGVPPRAFSRALRNLLKNGLDASAAREGTVMLRVGRADGNWTFEVTDTGSGIPPEVIARLTEPGFTTKSKGDGLGLGLHLTRTVLELLGGRLAIHSEVGRGTRVVCTLPGTMAAIRGFASLGDAGAT